MSKLIADITDCGGSETQLRLNLRIKSLFPDAHVEHAHILNLVEASGHIIGALQAVKGEPCIVLANVAPRGDKKKHKNGTPFCFQYVGDSLIVGTPDSFCLLKKLRIISHVHETDVLTVCEKFLSKREAREIANSQFRSYEYLPFLAKWLWEGKDVPSVKIEVPSLEENCVWHTDRFNPYSHQATNCKTTALSVGEFTDPKLIRLPFYKRLADVPKGTGAITRGSSGYGGRRLLEVVVSGGSAAERFGLQVGSKI